jgi:opacity protein-like surface antigen
MRNSLILAGLLLFAAGSALAQDEFPKVETSPAFMYIRTVPPGSAQSVNCAGGGGTIAYNFTKALGFAADMGGCKIFGFLPQNSSVGNKLTGNEFTFLFGPRITLRSSSPFQPFFELNFGGIRASISCNDNTACSGTSFAKSAFAMTVGGGFDIKLSRRFSLRPVQAEYLYSRFGNDCPLAVCSNNNNQNSFRLKSGIVMAWGGGSK